MNKTNITLTLASILALSTQAESYFAYTVNGHFKEADVEFTPQTDYVQVYDSGLQSWSWTPRTWSYPAAGYSKAKKAVTCSFPTMYYSRAWENGSIQCYCDTSYHYWTTYYYYGFDGLRHTSGYDTVVTEVRTQNVYQLRSIDYTSGLMAW
jgi:hypothetical protein